jgi:protocatechuate 3,4-dioxygenase beta subunit
MKETGQSENTMTTKQDHQLGRRKTLGLLGAAGATALVGWGTQGKAGAAVNTTALACAVKPAQLSCVVKPAQTEGPYFVDELLDRSDIRSDPATGLVKEGLPMRLAMNVYRVDGDVCTPLTGAFVDVWHCDALGVYSDVRDNAGAFDTRGQKFLRGYQVTDVNGAAEFITIYPGWYTGRTVHIHFKVRLFAGAQRTFEFTSQLYMDDAITDLVYARAPYNAKGPRSTRNNQDGIYRQSNSGPQLLLNLDRCVEGYVATFDIGLRMS